MGRILEALKPNDSPAQPAAALLTGNWPEAAEDVSEETPFVEVGGPRPASPPPLHAQELTPRTATLEHGLPRGVSLQPAAVARTATVAAELIAFHQPEHVVSQQYAALFAKLVAEANTDSTPVLLLSSLAPGAGTTSVLLNLAISGSRQNQQRIVVADANQARPAAAQRLGLANSAGLADVLYGQAALEEVVQTTAQPGLFVVPAGNWKQQPCATLQGLPWVLAWLRQRFDLVLVDAPAWDTKHLSELVAAADIVYLVVDAAEAGQPRVRTAARGAAQMGSRLGGLIVVQ